jgi:transcriptional regulator of aromatic amino acid metabolism
MWHGGYGGILSLQDNHFYRFATSHTMAEVQSQPVAIPQSDSTSASAGKDALVARLDELLEQYLHTLDEYQKARVQLSNQLSAVSAFKWSWIVSR